MSDLIRFASSLRRREPAVGFVRLRRTSGMRASRRSSDSRWRAAARLRSWDRCSEAVIVRTVPVNRADRRASARSR